MTLDLRTQVLEVASGDDVARALEALAKNRPAALIVLPGPMLFANGNDLVSRAERLSIPVIYPFEEMADAGGLMSYAPYPLTTGGTLRATSTGSSEVPIRGSCQSSSRLDSRSLSICALRRRSASKYRNQSFRGRTG